MRRRWLIILFSLALLWAARPNPFPILNAQGSIKTSLIEYWPLDEVSGNAIGLHAGLTLTDTNTVTSATGLVYALVRDFEASSNEHFTRTDEAALSTGDIDFTFAIWVYLESEAADQNIAGKCQDLATDQCEWHLDDNNTADRFTWSVSSGAGFANQTSVTANNLGAVAAATQYVLVVWHNATADTINIQGNNGTADSAAYAFGSYDSSADFFIGSAGFSTHYDGLGGPGMFWKKVLTADERTFLYNGGLGKTYAAFSPLGLLLKGVG